MYKFTVNGETIALVDNPVWIHIQRNGCYGPCERIKATGVAINSTPYDLPGHDIGGVATVDYEMVPTGTYLMNQDTVMGIAFVTLAEGGQIDDVTAGEHADLFSPWEPDVSYKQGNIRRYKDELYRCLQDHTSQEDWTPDTAVSLWVKIADPAEEWPEWSQPVGAHDAYNKGDRVSHNGKHWTSTVDGNVWEPGVYGWEESALH